MQVVIKLPAAAAGSQLFRLESCPLEGHAPSRLALRRSPRLRPVFESVAGCRPATIAETLRTVVAEKSWPGLKGYLLKSFFGDSKNKFAIVWLFKTVEDRNRNFNADGSANELEKAAREKVKPIEEKLKKMYGNYTVQYTHEDDWVVQ